MSIMLCRDSRANRLLSVLAAVALVLTLVFVVLYCYPLKLKMFRGGLGVEQVQQNAMCLYTIDRVPFSRNYSLCQR